MAVRQELLLDELQKLVDQRDSGQITAEQFEKQAEALLTSSSGDWVDPPVVPLSAAAPAPTAHPAPSEWVAVPDLTDAPPVGPPSPTATKRVVAGPATGASIDAWSAAPDTGGTTTLPPSIPKGSPRSVTSWVAEPDLEPVAPVAVDNKKERRRGRKRHTAVAEHGPIAEQARAADSAPSAVFEATAPAQISSPGVDDATEWVAAPDPMPALVIPSTPTKTSGWSADPDAAVPTDSAAAPTEPRGRHRRKGRRSPRSRTTPTREGFENVEELPEVETPVAASRSSDRDRRRARRPESANPQSDQLSASIEAATESAVGIDVTEAGEIAPIEQVADVLTPVAEPAPDQIEELVADLKTAMEQGRVPEVLGETEPLPMALPPELEDVVHQYEGEGAVPEYRLLPEEETIEIAPPPSPEQIALAARSSYWDTSNRIMLAGSLADFDRSDTSGGAGPATHYWDLTERVLPPLPGDEEEWPRMRPGGYWDRRGTER